MQPAWSTNTPAPSMLARIERWLTAWLSSPEAYNWARAHWWTRWMVRRRTLQLFDWMGGFVHSQVLLACVQLRLFDRLSDTPAHIEQLATELDMPTCHIEPLLQSAAAMDLLKTNAQDQYRVGPLGRIVQSHPGIAQMIEHNQLLYRDMADPLTFLRQSDQGMLAAYWPYAQSAGAQPALQHDAAHQLRRYSALMDASQGFVITEILSHYRFRDHDTVLDLGCGKGRFMTAVGQQHPHLKLQLFDLPAVLDLAQQRLTQAGLEGRAQFHPGSFLDDPLPKGADLVTLVRVAHDHSDQAVRCILQKIGQILPPGGRVLLAEPMQLSGSDAAVVDPYYHFYLQAMGRGRLRHPQQLMDLLRESGFVGVETIPTDMPIHAQLIVGHRPSVYPSINSEKSI